MEVIPVMILDAHRILKSSKHEEQAFNACAGILHRVKAIPKGIAEEAARKCIEMNSCRYSTYRQVLKKMECDEHPESFTFTCSNPFLWCFHEMEVIPVMIMAYRQKEYNYNDKLTKDQNLLMDKLYKMRMSGMAEAFENQLWIRIRDWKALKQGSLKSSTMSGQGEQTRSSIGS